jgi:hypothetical protein
MAHTMTMKTATLLLAALLCSVLTAVDARLVLPTLRYWTKPSADQAYVYPRCSTLCVLTCLPYCFLVGSAYHARQLVHLNTWATLSTNSIDFPGSPEGHIVSYSGAFGLAEVSWSQPLTFLCVVLDGIGKSAANSTGEIFFYLTKLDSAAQNLEKDARASLTISLAQEGEHVCKKDVMDPTCWKITIFGRVVPVTGDAKIEHAEAALFSKYAWLSTMSEQWDTDVGRCRSWQAP